MILQECYRTDRVWLSDGAGEKYIGEFVASLTPKTSNTATIAPRNAPIRVSPRKSFGPGSQWLYAKLYLGDQAFEELLRDVAPLISRWRESTVVDRWFFVRYADPEPHLRVRFRTTAMHNTTLRDDLLGQLERLLAEGRLIRYAFDTYDPSTSVTAGMNRWMRSSDFSRSTATFAWKAGTPSEHGCSGCHGGGDVLFLAARDQ